MINLVYNEMIKITGKRRLLVITLIIGILISLFTYAQLRQAQENLKRFGSTDWRVALEQRIAGWENRLSSGRTPEDGRAGLKARIDQQHYYLDHNINPAEPGAPTFVRGFVKSGLSLLLPLMMMIIAGTILSTMIASWESAKYLFMVNLQLIDYFENVAPPIAGMSLGFSVLVLLAWSALALIVSFVSFTRRDVY